MCFKGKIHLSSVTPEQQLNVQNPFKPVDLRNIYTRFTFSMNSIEQQLNVNNPLKPVNMRNQYMAICFKARFAFLHEHHLNSN